MTDTLLTRTYAATRSPEAFATLVTRYQRMVFATCRRKLHDASDLEDAVQETFLRLAQNAHALHTNVGAWLHRSAVNVSLDMNRRRTARHRHETGVAAQKPPAHDDAPQRQLAELREHLDAALAKLKPDQRELLIQRYFVGRPQTELAAERHLAPSTLNHRLTLAVEALRRHLTILGSTTAGAIALTALLEAESTSAAVPQTLTANLMKIGLTGIPAAVTLAAIPLLFKILAAAAALLLITAGAHWTFHNPAPPAPAKKLLAESTAPGITVGPDLPGQTAQPPNWKTTTAPATTAILAGRILDTAGKPVPNAKVSLNGPHYDHTLTDDDGNYEFDTLDADGEYHLSIEADGFIPVEPFATGAPAIQLSSQSQARRDIIIQRGVPLTITTVNDRGALLDPRTCSISLIGAQVQDVQPKRKSKGIQTCVLPASKAPYLVTVLADGFAPAHAQVIPASIDQPLNVRLAFERGISIQAIALCADGKPAAGWRINAAPAWWASNYSAPDFPIDEDGNVTLAHIIPGTYTLDVTKPEGESFSSEERLITLSLPPATQPLHLQIPGLSPSALTSVTGRLRIHGGRPQSVEISMDSTTDLHQNFMCVAKIGPWQSRTLRLKPDEGIFTLANIPPGTYRITIESPDVQRKVIDNVRLPGELDPIDVNYISQSIITGTITDARDHHPIQHLAFRLRKLQTLGDGPNWGQRDAWVQSADPDGHLHAQLSAGPGIYQIQLSADGYAWLWSPEIRIEKPGDGGSFALALTRGGSLAGTIVDPSGKPVPNAKVIPLSKAGAINNSEHFVSEAGATITDGQGHFLLTHLTAGDETLKVAAENFAPLIADHLHVVEDKTTATGELKLHVGGTVEGTIYDTNGQPAPGVALSLQDTYGYVGPQNETGERLASVLTDARGHYHLNHLPDQLLYVQAGEIFNHLAVFQRVFLPRDGIITHLDFGGEKRITGRLLTNGAPARNGTIELAAGDAESASYFGSVQLYASADDQGHFTLRSPPLGTYTLYSIPTAKNHAPMPLQEIDITETTTDLGDIAMDLGTVRFTLAANDPVDRVPLHDLSIDDNRHPERFWQDGVAYPSQVPDKPREWVALNVPATPLLLHVPISNQVELLFPFQRAPKNIETHIVCNLPAAFATLNIPEAGDAAQQRQGLRMVSTDGRISARFWLDPKKPQTLRIPAATYFLMDSTMETMDSQIRADRITFAPGETRTFHPADFPLRAAVMSVIELHAFSHEGVLLTSSRPELFNEKQQPLVPTDSSYLGSRFHVPPGTYHAMFAPSHGAPVSQTIDVSPNDLSHPIIINLFLQ